MIKSTPIPLECPPHLYLCQVLEHCPRAGSTYLKIWREKNDENQLILDKENFRQEHLISLTKFKNDLFYLVKEGLISVEETPTSLKIDIVAWDE